MEIDKAKNFMTWLYTIWDAVRGDMIQQVITYVQTQSYDVNQKRIGDEMTPLHVAVNSKRLNMVKTLLSLGADIEAVDKNGLTVIDYVSVRKDSFASKIKRILKQHISKMDA